LRITVEQEYEKTIRTIADGLFFGNVKAYQLYSKLAVEDQVAVDNILYRQRYVSDRLLRRKRKKIPAQIAVYTLLFLLIFMLVGVLI